MRSVLWHHDNQSLIHPSPHPAYEIWQSNLAGEKLSVVASNTSRIKQISRINNGKDFSFASYLLNRDIYLKPTKDGDYSEPINLDNSSVMDYLPALSNESEQYAFVSKRSTTAEVYLANVPNESSVQQPSKRITFFNNPVKIYQLVFSPSDDQLLVLADNQIFIADIINDTIKMLPIDNIAISGVSWQNEQSLMFSTIKNNDWYLMQYNINEDKLTNLPLSLIHI